jgi:hypothetical protein
MCDYAGTRIVPLWPAASFVHRGGRFFLLAAAKMTLTAKPSAGRSHVEGGRFALRLAIGIFLAIVSQAD